MTFSTGPESPRANDSFSSEKKTIGHPVQLGVDGLAVSQLVGLDKLPHVILVFGVGLPGSGLAALLHQLLENLFVLELLVGQVLKELGGTRLGELLHGPDVELVAPFFDINGKFQDLLYRKQIRHFFTSVQTFFRLPIELATIRLRVII
jgi:hypothetical protein